MTAEEIDLEKWEATEQVYPPDVPGGIVGMCIAVFAQTAFLGLIVVVTSPIWIMGAIIVESKKILNPEPKPVYRGTVRPLVPIAPRKAHSR